MFSSIDVFPIKSHIKEVLRLHGLTTGQDVLSYTIDELAKGKFVIESGVS